MSAKNTHNTRLYPLPPPCIPSRPPPRFCYVTLKCDTEVYSLAFTPDDRMLATCGADRIIRIWELNEYAEVQQLYGHVDAVLHVQWIRNGIGLLSNSMDGTMKTWQIKPQVPDPPQRPAISNVSTDECLMKWNAPLCYNERITHYVIEQRIGIRKGFHCPRRVGPVTQFRMEHLLPGRAYQFRVAAVNACGMGEFSAPSAQTNTTSTAPAPPEPRPEVIVEESQSSSLTISWIAPDPMGSPVQSFIIQVRGGEWHTFADGDKVGVGARLSWKECRALASDLDIGEAVDESVKAAMDAKYRSSALVRLQDRVDRRAEARRRLALGIDENSEELARMAHVHEPMEGRLAGCNAPMAATLSGLRPGLMYQFRVCAVNAMGQGEWSRPSLSRYTLCLAPAAPEPPRAVRAELHSITLEWDPPDENGSPISHWVLCNKMTGQEKRLKHDDGCTHCWDKLAPGESYRFTVRALNRVGVGAASAASEPIATLKGVPAAPAPPIPFGPSPVWISVRWSPPLITNGAAVTGFSLVRVEGNDENFSKEMLIDVKDLTLEEAEAAPVRLDARGQEIQADREGAGEGEYRLRLDGLYASAWYQFRIAAINEVGRGPYSELSEPASTMPPEAPPMPLGLLVRNVTYFSCDISWQLGIGRYSNYDNGAPITSFVLQVRHRLAAPPLRRRTTVYLRRLPPQRCSLFSSRVYLPCSLTKPNSLTKTKRMPGITKSQSPLIKIPGKSQCVMSQGNPCTRAGTRMRAKTVAKRLPTPVRGGKRRAQRLQTRKP